MLIIPDVHGRSFWKEALKYPDEEKIFLGDYVDPYPSEGISQESIPQTLREIIEFKKSDPKVTLLIGNHDLMYMHPAHKEISCRHDYAREKEISDILLGNIDLFDVVAIRGRYLFSHSGVQKSWLEYSQYTLDDLNDLKDNRLMEYLAEVCYSRGGWLPYGSPVWGDLSNFYSSEEYLPEFYQIFGHTQLVSDYITPYFACLDCRKIFRLDEDGEIWQL